MSPSIGHPTVLAVGTWTKVTGSRRVTTLLTNRVWFCCLPRPQIASEHFRTRVPCSPFALRVCLQALRGDNRVEMQMGLGRTPRTLLPAAFCCSFVRHLLHACLSNARICRDYGLLCKSVQFSSPAAR